MMISHETERNERTDTRIDIQTDLNTNDTEVTMQACEHETVCPACDSENSEPALIGILGKRWNYCCIYCGAHYSVPK